MIVDIDGLSIEVTRKAIKSINLRVYPPDGRVRVSMPWYYSEKALRKHLQEKLSWINAQRERIQGSAQALNEVLQTGSAIEFMGKTYLLVINEQHGPSQIQIKDQMLHCYIAPLSSQAKIQAGLEKWYKREMTTLLPDLISHWQAIVGVHVKEWGIKKMKTRWGSCNTRAARIWLNLNLIKKPLICLEYVLVHELVHLLEASHNKRFYALMTEFMPQWREYQQSLEAKGQRGPYLNGEHLD